jgi:translation initiation factor 4G
MIAELYKENLMLREDYVLAFKKFWEGYEDLVIDVPQAPKHVDRLLAATGIERSEVECDPQDY